MPVCPATAFTQWPSGRHRKSFLKSVQAGSARTNPKTIPQSKILRHFGFIFPDISQPLRGRAPRLAAIGEFGSVMVKHAVGPALATTSGHSVLIRATRLRFDAAVPPKGVSGPPLGTVRIQRRYQ